MILNVICNCTRLVLKGDWPRLAYIANVKWHGLDFKYADVLELGLSPDRSRAHEESFGPALDRALRTLPISAADSALDIGCGKGAAMWTLARYPFLRVDGVEISAKLIEVARENLRKAKVRKANLFHGNAADFANYESYNFYYLYNPFPPEIMIKTITLISESIQRRPRAVTLLYMNPKDDQIIKDGGFTKVIEFAGKTGQYAPIAVYKAGPNHPR